MPDQIPLVIDVSVRDDVAILQMKGKENRINFLFCKTWLKVLDDISIMPNVKVAVTTGWEKFYSNGLDLAYLSKLPKEKFDEFQVIFSKLIKKFITLPVVTIAAINGHCFAGGVIFALCHDYRVMQKGRGWMCLNEVDISRRFNHQMISLLTLRLNKEAIRDSAIFGRRLVAEEALRLKMVDKICELGEAVPTAVEMGKNLVKNRSYSREMLQVMKEDFYWKMLQSNPDERSKL